MGKEDIYEVYKVVFKVMIIFVYMEVVNYWMLLREELKGFIKEKDMIFYVFVSDDGEVYIFKQKRLRYNKIILM